MQVTAAVRSNPGQPRDIVVKFGETLLILPADSATKFGTQLIELAAVARAQDAAATIAPAPAPTLIVPS
jgi:phosphate-selective porin